MPRGKPYKEWTYTELRKEKVRLFKKIYGGLLDYPPKMNHDQEAQTELFYVTLELRDRGLPEGRSRRSSTKPPKKRASKPKRRSSKPSGGQVGSGIVKTHKTTVKDPGFVKDLGTVKDLGWVK